MIKKYSEIQLAGALGMVLFLSPISVGAEVTWSSPIAVAGAPRVTTTITGDFNGDGLTDFASFEGGKHASNSKLFAWFESPNFTKHNINTSFATVEFLGSAFPIDLDGDGDLDIVFSMDHHSGTTREGWIYWAKNPLKETGSATGNWTIILIKKLTPTVDGDTEHINDMVVTDMDKDGKLDIIVRHLPVSANKIRLFFQNTLTSWTMRTLNTKPREGLSIADFDGDNRKDILLNGFWLAAPSDPRTGTWTEYSIDSVFYTQANGGLNNATKSSVADINKDGLIDAVIATAEGALGKASVYINPGSPRTQPWIERVLEPSITDMHQAELGDIASIAITATASDSDGTISKVEFFNGSTKLGEDTTSPYSFVWQTVPAGIYQITARAIDNDGGSKISNPVQVTVYNTSTNPPREEPSELLQDNFGKFTNVFNPSEGETLSITYGVTSPTFVNLKILDIKGNEIMIFDEEKSASPLTTVEWDGKNKKNEIVAAGIYILVLEIENNVKTKKVVVVK